MLLLLGFPSCGVIGGESVEEYGMPYVTYKLKGKVVNEEETPVRGIQLIVREADRIYGIPGDTLYSDAAGEFFCEKTVFPKSNLKVIYKDLREQSTVYKTDSVEVNMENTPVRSGRWYSGEFSKEITIKLEEKKTDE